MTNQYTPAIELILEQFRALIDDRSAAGRPLSFEKIGKGIGMSAATVHNFYKRKELGDVKHVSGLIKNFVERERARDDAPLLAVPFVETRQAKRMMQAITLAHQSRKLVAIVSPSGTGKSTVVKEAQRRDASIVHVYAANFYGPSAILQEICEALREPQTGTCRALMKRIKFKLKGTGRLLMIDDAHNLRAAAMSTVQTIYDQCEIGVALLGIRKLETILTGVSDEREQMASRVAGRIFEVPEVNTNDLAMILSAVMPEDEVQAALDLLGTDPSTLLSPRRMCAVLEFAGLMAKKQKAELNIKHIRNAMKLSAA